MTKEILRTTLTNGLTLIGEPNPAHMSAAMGFFVRTGSRDEVPVEAGVSHFLEHMMFKGTAKRSSLDITYELGNLGAQANAFTSDENTVYYGVVTADNQRPFQELLSDMLRPSLDKAEFDTEKKVILEEIALYQDRPTHYLFEKAYGDYFGSHPAGNSVLGTTESVSAITRDQMQDYFSRRYRPSAVACVCAGNFAWDAFVKNAESWCGGWEAGEAPRLTPRHEPKTVSDIIRRKNLSQSHVVLLNRGCSAQDPERYPLTILATILGDSSGSKLYWELVDSGLAESASTDSDERDGAGCFGVYSCTSPDKLDQVVSILKRVLRSPLDFSDKDLDRAKTKLVSRVVLDGELPMGRLMSLGLEWNYRHETTPLKTVVERVKGITRSDIEKALEKFPWGEWSEFRLIPE